MIRTLLLSIWGASVALGVLYMMMKPPSVTEAEAAMAAKKKPKPNVFTEPTLLVTTVITEDNVKGYVFANTSLELKAKALKGVKIPTEMILQDAYHEYMIGNASFSFPDSPTFDVSVFRSGMTMMLEKTFGEGTVESVVVQNVNFIPAKDVRTAGKLNTLYVQSEDQKRMQPNKEEKKDKKEKDEKGS